MRKAVIVFWPAGLEMVNQWLPRLAIKPVEILVGKGAQARMSSEAAFGAMVHMGGALVQNQLNASRVPIAASHLPHAPQKVLMVVLVQTPTLHRAIVDVDGHLKGDRPLPFIFTLASLYFARLHGLSGPSSRQGLDVRFFVHTDHHFPALVKPVTALITPQDLGSPDGKLLINHGGLPITAAMRLQTSLRQDPGHRRIMNDGDHCLLHDKLLQTTAVPVGQV